MKLWMIVSLCAAWLHVTCLAAEPPINTMCPVTTDEGADPAITTTYKRRTIAFCSDKCLRMFQTDPERYVAGLPEFVQEASSAAEETSAPSKGPAPPRKGSRRLPLLARYHPVIAHFPVVGFPLALLGFLLFRLSGKPGFAAADVPPLLVATLVAIPAVVSGNVAQDALRFSAALQLLVERHESAGTTLLIMGVALSLLRLWRWNRMRGIWAWLYGFGLLFACLVSAGTGYLGGSIVFGPDHLSF